MPAKLEEITAIYLGERFRFENPDGDVVIGVARDEAGGEITIKGQADRDELTPYLSYRLYGRWSNYTNRKTGVEEKQFHFQTFVKNQPYDRAGVITYLCEAGAGHGLGPARAAVLWDKFQSDAVRVMRETPEVALSALERERVPITEEQAAAIVRWLDEEKNIEACKLELTTLLVGRGFPKTTIREAVREWGNQAAGFIKNDPYRLMRFRGCGFKRADAMYLDLGLPAGRLKRQTLCAWYTIARNTDGHTWFPLEIALSGIKANISGAKINEPKAMQLAKRSKALSFIRTGLQDELIERGGKIWCAEGRKARNELRLAEFLAAALAEPAAWPIDIDDARKLSDHQRERLAAALSGTISILGGSPGTGKTFTAAELIGLIVQTIGFDHIAVCAPTGKAAVRVTEAMESYGLPLRARTIHSLLGVASNSKNGGWGFEHNEFCPLQYKFIIVDECFPRGTQVETPSGFKPIETVAPGESIINAAGVDTVVAVGRKEVHRAVKITVGKTHIVCSENHPLFTSRGYVSALNLKPGDSLVSAAASVRLLRDDDPPEEIERGIAEVLRSKLQCEMVASIRQSQTESLYEGTSRQVRSGKEKVSGVRLNGGGKPNRQDSQIESDGERICSHEGFQNAPPDGTQADHSWWKRPATASSAAAIAGSAGESVVFGIYSFDEQASRLAESLQTRYCPSGEQDLYRMRRSVAPFSETSRPGCQKDGVPSLGRVDSVEILEQGNPELDQFRDADGKLYFYDLQASRHPSFSVEGWLVHNCSMIDTDLAASLLAARPKGCHMLFVGDVNQLPPVGHGAPLRDMIAAGLPYGELREIRRNSGAIVEACAAIRDGKPFRTCETVDIENGENFKVAEVARPDQQIDTMLRAVRRSREIGFDPIWDCQVLVPVNDKSPLARKSLNEILQRELNQNPGVSGSPFRIGDKIVNTKNGWFRPAVDLAVQSFDADDPSEIQTNDRGEIYVANGELAKVIKVEEKLTVAELSNPKRIINIPRGKVSEDDSQSGSDESDSKAPTTGCTWDLGYALSCHKSQGSEWPIVVVMVDDYPGARMVASREWTYTAISRAKKLCLAIGKLATLQASCRKVALGKRKTFLKELILRERAKVEAAKQQTPELVETA